MTETDATQDGLLQQNSPRNESESFTIDQAINAIGYGAFQKKLLFVCGLGYLSATMELVLLAFLLHEIDKSDWGPLSSGQKSLLGAVAFSGSLLGSLFWGWLSDVVGRKFGFVATVLISSVFGLSSALAPSFRWIILFRFLVGFALGGNMSVDFVLFMEIVPEQRRGRLASLLILFGVGGVLLTAALAWVVLPRWGWRWFLGLCSLPSFSVLFVRTFALESPRYLIANGHVDDAEEVLRKMALTNGVALPVGKLRALQQRRPQHDVTEAQAQETAPLASAGSFDSDGSVPHAAASNSMSVAGPRRWTIFERFGMLLSPGLRVTSLFLWITWFCLTFGYYGLTIWLPTLLSNKGMGASLYRTYFLMGVAELPGLFLAQYCVEKYGRRFCLCSFLFACACCTLLFGAANTDVTVSASSCACYFFVVGAWSSIYIYTPELYPTILRTTASGGTSIFATLGGIVSPIVGAHIIGEDKESTQRTWLALFVYSGAFLCGAIAALCLPTETRGLQLKDLVE